ncbi:MAG: tetratricopeptide repeat protein [Gemmatimonadaceae bacterium]|nr:tetratricopeptide repeat protein [Gemmatimonadaceae bacterium]
MFALRLFGGLFIDGDDAVRTAAARQRRRTTLLALLALSGEQGASRDRLLLYLWPDSSSARARHALDQLVYATRRDFGADAVLSTGTGLRLNPAVVQPDLWVFDEAIRDGAWEAAVAMHRGPLLDGVHLIDDAEFESWLDGQRSRREQDYRGALERLARAATARDDHAAAARWWRERVASDRTSVDATLALMRALAATGDHGAAIAEGRAHQRFVRGALEMEPDPRVHRLAQELATTYPVTCDDPPPARASVDPAIPAPAAPRIDDGHRAAPRRVRFRTLAALTAVALLVLTARQGMRAARAAKRDAVHAAIDPAARTLYLRAHEQWESRTRAGLENAVVEYRLATERDPQYADAWAGMAQSYALLGYFGFAPGDAMFAKAKAAAQQAIALDSTAGDAYAALGQALAWEHDWAGAEQAYRRAIALTPRDATVHQWYALLLAYLGRAHEAARETAEASRLDPLSVQINNMHGVMLYHDGRLDEALGQFARTVDAEPDSAWVRRNPWVLCNFGYVAGAAGRYPQAIGLIERALRVVPANPRALLDLATVYVEMGDSGRARAAFAAADSTHPHYPMYRAMLEARIGARDSAFAWLGRVREWSLPALVRLSNDTAYAALRADPRFATVRRRLALPP